MQTGVLLLHGFTSNDASLAKLTAAAQSLGYVTEAPLLRGHGRTYRDLYGARWDHWRADAQAGLERLRAQVDQVVVVGFSMGGLLALEVAAQPQADLAGVVALAPALFIAHPLAPIAWMALGWYRFLPMGKAVAYSDPALASADESYSRLATDAFVSFYRASHRIRRLLPSISAPLLLIHSLRDRVIKPISSQFAYDHVGSAEKELVWLDRTGHALMDDIEAATVVAHVRSFLERYVQPPTNAPALDAA